MKLFNRIKLTLLSIRGSIKRFPITVFVSTLLALFLIYMNESNLTRDSLRNLEKISFILGLGIPLSLSIGLLVERFYKKDKSKTIVFYGLGVGFLVLYYLVLLKDFEMMTMVRYLGTMLFLLLAFLYVSRLGRKEGYEYYVMDVYSGFALTFIYSFVLYFGIAAIFFTIDQLFDVNIKGKFYYYMFLIVTFVFAVGLFLSKLPSVDEEYKNVEYTKALNVLLLYIVIPLISIYTAILYVYFAKILVTMEWPKGLVSHLVLWYSTISVGVIFLITPILEHNKVAKLFKIWFPKVILPVLLMMFMSIYQRIEQYGITENRYYIIVLALWVFGIMIYFSLKKPLRNIIIPISLSIVILNSVFGPLSSFAISNYSQNKRFEGILSKNNMLINGEIVKNDTVSSEDKKEISNIISYFKNKNSLTSIKVLPKDFNLNNMESILGFKHEPYYSNPYAENNYFYYGTNSNQEAIDISGYDYYLNVNSWNEDKIEVGELILQYNKSNNIFSISDSNGIILEQDIVKFVEDIHRKQDAKSPNEEKAMVHYEDMTYKLEHIDDMNGIGLKFIFTNINGRTDSSDKLTIDSIDFILLIRKK